MNTLKAEKRNMQIKAKKLRREGDVTGNVFGREIKGSMPIQIEKAAVERLLKSSGKGSQIYLEVEGQTLDVLIKEVDFNPLKNQVDEIDFQALVSGEKVHSVAEIHLLNQGKVTTGIVEQVLHELSFKALPSALVEKIEVDVGDLQVGDTIKVKDLPVYSNPDVDVLTDADTTVVTVGEVHAEPEDEPDTEAKTE